MNILIFLIPIALGLGVIGLVAFLWNISKGQYDDLDSPPIRILTNSEEEEKTRDQ